ncbi:MAG: thiamine pyrophosphate-binding protein [Dethiosulfovibrio sp.]|nr:thiamine pyrophosphate-binding protein [Dethiosulfovibrio sp.]
MKASDWIASYLADRGIDRVFEMIGGMTTHLLDSIYREGRSSIVTVHHEQAGAMAACGWAQVKGLPGVALATSGPGAVNLLTGVGTCYFDSVPAIFITGQVNRNELSTGRPMRQLGFQETDVVSMAKAITKGSVQVTDPEDIPEIMGLAFKTAMEGRPGPVLIDIPMDVQRGDVPVDTVFIPEEDVVHEVDVEEIEDFVLSLSEALTRSSRPLVLVGNGVVRSGCSDDLAVVLDGLGAPVVYSLMGKGAVKGDLVLGMIGTYGNRWANYALSRCDLLIVLGSRLDVRQTGADVDRFSEGKAIFQVDVDPGEIDGRVQTTCSLASDLRAVMPYLLKKQLVASPSSDWLDELSRLRVTWDDRKELGDISGINPNRFMRELGENSPAASCFVTDIGAHQMWAAQSLETYGRRFMSSGGMGAMGYALPAGMGASLALDRAPVVVIAGDGGFQCNLQELQTVVRNGIPLKMVVMDNRSLGMVRQFQEAYFEGRYPGTVWGYDSPDFTSIAEAYGIRSMSISSDTDVEEGIRWLWDDPGPSLLVVSISPEVGIAPKMAFGRGLDEMEPIRPLPTGGVVL